MSWGEAIRLTNLLAADPSSHVAASLAGWEHPASREWLVLADLFDAFRVANFKKPAPYPRPWSGAKRERMKPTVSQSDVVAALRAAGHAMPIPTR